MKFDNLYFISHQPGTIGDSLTALLSMHEKKASFRIVGNRMRTTTPGILLNWAYYYKNWSAQKKDPNLWKAINLQKNVSNFAQAHFFLQEHELLEKFPGCRIIRLLVRHNNNIEVYFKWLYAKLLSKKMHRAWHDRYLKFAPLNNAQTQSVLATMCMQKTLQVRHYWSAWYIDTLGMDLNLIPNPWEYWLTRQRIVDFHPNLPSMHINNDLAQQQCTTPEIFNLYIDDLFSMGCSAIDLNTYLQMCEFCNLKPNLALCDEFLQWWQPLQPPVHDIGITPKW